MPIVTRHGLAIGLAILFLCGAVFIPNRPVDLICASLSLVAMIASLFIISTGVQAPLKAAAQSLRKLVTEGAKLPDNRPLDISALTSIADSSLRDVAGLRDRLARAEGKAEEAEREAQEMRQSLEDLHGQYETLQDHRQKMADNAEALYGQIWSVVQALSQLVGSVAQGVAEQRFRMDDASGSMSMISNQVDQVANSAESASTQAQSSREVATSGVQELRVAVNSIEEVKERTMALKETMTILREKADNIGRVMGFINDVADQTNLLALNAAIEAARAGESGRGFAVVADEVRNLAKKTMQATDEVAQAVSSIQNQTLLTIQAVEDAADQTVQTAERASSAGTSMSFIVENMEQAAQQLENIAEATKEQSESSHHTNTALKDIRHVAMNTADNMENFTSYLVQLTGSMEKLGNVAYALKTGSMPEETGRLVEWSESLATGFRIIDEQHKMLLNYINSLHLAMKRGVTNSQMLDILNVLYEYTVSHFSTEELYFTRSEYRDINKHLELHHKFTSKIAEYREAVANGSAAVSMELLNFLRDWLIHHIQGTDHQYVESVSKMLQRERSM